MRKYILFQILFFSICLLALNGCQKTDTLTPASTQDLAAAGNTTDLQTSNEYLSEHEDNDADNGGVVFVMDNGVSGNNVLIYDRDVLGALTRVSSVPTGGKGTGAGLGSQGSLVRYGNLLYACNAGSNEITVFKIYGHNLTQLDKVSSHGTNPISVTAYGNWVYVLNGGGNGNISGFRLDYYGHLNFISGSEKALSNNNVGPAQIKFSPWGNALVVTEKTTNLIDVYRLNRLGVPSALQSHPSTGMTPFGFEFDNRGNLIVSDAFGGAVGKSALTSYNLNYYGNLNLITGPVATTQTAACWVV